MDDQSKNVNCCEVEDFTQKKITAKEHPKWYDPWCLIFGVIVNQLKTMLQACHSFFSLLYRACL